VKIADRNGKELVLLPSVIPAMLVWFEGKLVLLLDECAASWCSRSYWVAAVFLVLAMLWLTIQLYLYFTWKD